MLMQTESDLIDRPGHRRRTLGLIGAGAFGEFCLPYLTRHFEVTVADSGGHLPWLAEEHWVRVGEIEAAARHDIVVLAVPLDALPTVARRIAPLLRPGALVLDVCSLKVEPLWVLRSILPRHVRVVGTHPLFGPQSGRDGIAGLAVAICADDARLGTLVARFLRQRFGLVARPMSAEQHDREMAQVQALTHLVARMVLAMDLGPVAQTTTAYDHLMRLVEVLRHDSDELFRAIIERNPYARSTVASFLDAGTRIQAMMSGSSCVSS